MSWLACQGNFLDYQENQLQWCLAVSLVKCLACVVFLIYSYMETKPLKNPIAASLEFSKLEEFICLYNNNV